MCISSLSLSVFSPGQLVVCKHCALARVGSGLTSQRTFGGLASGAFCNERVVSPSQHWACALSLLSGRVASLVLSQR